MPEENIEYVVEKIVNHRKKGNSYEFEIKWRGYPSSENTWQLYNDVSELSALDEYLAKHPVIKKKVES